MAEIRTLAEVGINQQNDFLLGNYRNFIYSAVYGFLFEGLNLRELEVKYLGLENDGRGFFAKNVLNMIGIDTSKPAGNCGRFAGRDVQAVARVFMTDKDPVVCNIGRILAKRI